MENEEFKVTEKNIEEAITHEQYMAIGFKTIICALVLNSGFEVIGSFSPVEGEDYDLVTGKQESKKAALRGVLAYLSGIAHWKKAVTNQEETRAAEALKQAEGKGKDE